MTTLSLAEALDTLQDRLTRLDQALPPERNDDEREAMTAMESCAHELRRLALLVEPARQREAAATGSEQEQAHTDLHRLLHDLRTPAGVLYTYLKIIADGQLFGRATTAQHSEALSLSTLVRDIREQA